MLSSRLARSSATLVAALFVVACAGDGTGVGGPGDTEPTAPTLSGDVQPILTGNCAFSGCHAGSSPAQGMNLSEGQTFSSTVGVASNELPTMNRIEPGDADQSYLVNKIQGTQDAVGGSGGQMPLGGTPLTTEQVTTIRAWVEAGAENN
jgi:hypothetical protein